MKSYHLLKFYKCFDKKREETLIQQSMKKEKVRKAGLCFITGCFLKHFKILINRFFFISQAHRNQFLLFDVRMTQKISKVGNWERQIARNGKLQYLFQI